MRKVILSALLCFPSLGFGAATIRVTAPDGEIKSYDSSISKSFTAGRFSCFVQYTAPTSKILSESIVVACESKKSDELVSFSGICFLETNEFFKGNNVGQTTPHSIGWSEKGKVKSYTINFECK
jgi:hypothetical protein